MAKDLFKKQYIIFNVYFQSQEQSDKGAKELERHQEALEAAREGIVNIVGVIEYEGYIAIHMLFIKESLAEKCGKKAVSLNTPTEFKVY